jgi:hypothetical protein
MIRNQLLTDMKKISNTNSNSINSSNYIEPNNNTPITPIVCQQITNCFIKVSIYVSIKLCN